MKILLKWIEEIVGIDRIDVKDFENTLKSLGIGVEDIITLSGKDYTSARVVEVKDDNMILFDGRERKEMSFIKGIEPGDVVFVKDGTLLYEKELFGTDGGVVKVQGEPGVKFSEIFGNTVFELEVPPNRFDLLSHVGIAREFAAHHRIEWNEPHPPTFEAEAKGEWDIVVEDEDLLGYTGVFIKGVKVVPSPFEIKWRLYATGLRPINNLVDITNYILLKYGQPLHIFDVRFIEGNRIVVRRGREGEKIRVIGGIEVKLNNEVMVIADQAKPLAIAGIIGGEESEVREDTESILLECADFSPPRIKRGTQVTKIITDSSKRFETRVDPLFRRSVITETVDMINSLSGGEVVSAFDYEKEKFIKRKVQMDPKRVNRVLGIDMDSKEMERLLNDFGFRTERDGEKIMVEVPSFRHDIKIEEDLMEEIARIKGYDSIPEVFSFSGYKGGKREEISILKNHLRHFLVSRGFYEVVTLSFSNQKENSIFKSSTPVEILNPISERWNQMRTSIIPSLMGVVKENVRYGIRDIRLFELGRVYFDEGEKEMLSLVLTGKRNPVFWGGGKDGIFDIYDLKGIMEDIFSLYNVIYRFDHEPQKGFLRGGRVILEGGEGVWGEIAPSSLDIWDIEQRVFAFEIPLNVFLISRGKRSPSIMKFPVIERDLSLLVGRYIPVDEVKRFIEEKNWFDEVHVFDYYSGENIPADKKVVGIRVVLYPSSEVGDEKVESLMSRVVDELKKNYNITLRGGNNG